jgi:hypothetical protein
MSPDYSKGKIYRIASERTTKIYVGSTTQPLLKRFSAHRSSHKRFVTGLQWNGCTASEILKYGDARIELVENGQFENKLAMEKRELQVIVDNLPIVVNVRIPGSLWQQRGRRQAYKQAYQQINPINERKSPPRRVRRRQNRFHPWTAVKDKYKPKSFKGVCHIIF